MSAVVLAVIAIIIFGDLSAFREKAQKEASETLGIPVTISGDMSLRPSLPPLVALNDIQIGNPDWAFHDNFLRADRLYLTLSLAALLSGNIQIDALELASFEMIVEKNPEGNHNWGSNKDAAASSVETITLTDGVVRWVDHRGGPFPEIQIDKLEAFFGISETDLEADIEVEGHRIEISAEADPVHGWLEGTSPWRIDADLTGEDWSLETVGQVETGLTAQLSMSFEADDLSVLNDLHGLALPPLGAMQIEASLSTRGNTLIASDLRIEVGENQLAGDIELSMDEPGVRVRAEINADQFQLADFWHYQQDRPTTATGDYLDTTIPLVSLILEDIDVDITVTAPSLRYQDAEIGAAGIHILSKEGTGSVSANATILGGKYEALATLTTDGDTPRFALEGNAAELDLDDLTPDQHGLPIGGQKVNTSFDVTATGQTWRDLLASLNARVLIENITFNNPPVFASDGDVLIADKLLVQASDGNLSAIDLTGRLGEKPIHLEVSGTKPILALGDSAAWPLKGSIDYADARLTFDGELEPRQPAYRGRLQAATPDINTLGSLLGLPPVPVLAFSLEARIVANTQLVSLDDLSVQLGGSKLKGKLDRRVEEDRLLYSGSLSARVINPSELQQLLPSDRGERWLPQDVDAELTLTVDSLRGGYEKLSAIALSASLNESKLVVSPFSLIVDGAPVSGKLNLDDSVSPARIGAQFSATELDTSLLEYFSVDYPGLTLEVGQIEVDAHTQGIAFPGVLEQLSLQIRAEGARLAYSHGTMETEVKELRFDVSSAPGESLIVKAEGIHENFPLKVDLSVDNLLALNANQPVSVSATTKSSHSSIRVTGQIASPWDLDGVSVKIEAQGTRFEILHPSLWLGWEQTGAFAFETALEHVDHQLTLRNLDADFSGNDLRGSIVVPTDADGRIEVHIESSSIAIGDVLEPELGEEQEVTPSPYIIPSFPLADALPLRWNGDFEWHINRLQLDDSVFKNVKVDAQLEDGRMSLTQTGVTHPGNGPFALGLTIDPAASPAAHLKVTAEQFDLGWVLPNEADAQPHWPTDIDIDLKGPAETFQQLMGGSNGIIEVSGGQTEDAEFEKWDFNLLSRMLPDIGAKSLDQINCIVIHLDVEDGMATGDGAVMETQHAIVAGGGAVDLRSEHLGLVLSARPKDKALLNLTASLKVEGTLRDPELASVSTDVASSAAQILLGVANPFSLLGSFVLSSGDNDNTACEAALKAAAKKSGGATTEGTGSQNTGLFDLLFSGKRKDE